MNKYLHVKTPLLREHVKTHLLGGLCKSQLATSGVTAASDVLSPPGKTREFCEFAIQNLQRSCGIHVVCQVGHGHAGIRYQTCCGQS